MGKIPSFDTMEFSWNTDNIIIFPKGMMQIKNTIPYLTNIQDSLPHVFMRFFVFLIAIVLLTGCTHKNSKQPKDDVVTTTQNSTATSTVDISDWLTYENTEYGFSFRYPGGWEIEKYDEVTSFFGPKIIGTVFYRDAFSFEITTSSFEELKDNIEKADLLPDGQSLSSFRNVQNSIIAGRPSKSGSHATALGIARNFYFIPLNNPQYSLYIDFDEPTDEINVLIKDVVATLELF